jgi:tetratricopeptide (TPR) repeat protein
MIERPLTQRASASESSDHHMRALHQQPAQVAIATYAIEPGGTDAGSLAKYQKALELRQVISREESDSLRAQRDLAFSLSKVGDGQFFNGHTDVALADYQQALGMGEAVLSQRVSDPQSQKVAGYIQNRRCIVLAAAGDAVRATEACRASIAHLDQVALSLSQDRLVRRTLASTCAAFGNLLRHLNQIPEALRYLAKASALFEALTVEQPNNVEYRRLIAYTQGAYEWNDYANALLKSEIESLRQPAKALELALRATRATKESNAMYLDTLAWAYFRTGDAPSAIRTERRALSLVPAGNALGQGLRVELEQGLAQFETPIKK